MKKALGLIFVVLVLASGLGFGQTVVAKEWDIPFLNCLTGPIAAYGELFQWSADRAASEINAAGGIKGKPVKLVGVATGSDPQQHARGAGPCSRAGHPRCHAHRGGGQDGFHDGEHLV